MSTLSLHDLQGISAFSNKIRVPSGHRLTFDGALKLRNLSTANLPATGNEEGDIIYNTDTKQISIWTGAAWTGAQDGSTAEGAVCLLYTSPSPRDGLLSRMPSSA